MKHLFIILLIILCYSSKVYAQYLKDKDVPIEIRDYMTNKYPKVEFRIYDSLQNGYKYMVLFNNKDTYTELSFINNFEYPNQKYILQSLSKSISIKQIPSAIKKSVKINFNNGIIKNTRLVEHYIQFNGNEKIPCNYSWYVLSILYKDIEGKILEREITFDKKGNIIPSLAVV